MFHSERQFVHWLQSQAPQRGNALRLGIGDDAALLRLRPGHELIVTTDLSVEGIHFADLLHPPRSVGHRALARALSDIAAMGGKPKFALVSMALSRRRAGEWTKDFYRGFFRLARRFDVSVIGGDTAVHAGPTVVDVIAVGEAPRGRSILRRGAKAGDAIFVGGRLGSSALGLRVLKARLKQPMPKAAAGAIRAHLFPEPQCRLGEFLLRRSIATSAMDLSDGLSLDLARLCEASGVGARIRSSRLPVPPGSQRLGLNRRQAEQLALDGGEDYKLLFTVSPKRALTLPRKFAGSEVFRIGEITTTQDLLLVRDDGREENLLPKGYDHFRVYRKSG